MTKALFGRTNFLGVLTLTLAALFLNGSGMAQDADNPEAAKPKDFTFIVPVEIRSLVPEVEKVVVSCRVFRSEAAEFFVADNRVGGKTVVVPDPEVTKEISISFDAYEDNSPEEAVSWKCMLFIYSNEKYCVPEICSEEELESKEHCCARDSSQPVIEVSGTLQ